MNKPFIPKNYYNFDILHEYYDTFSTQFVFPSQYATLLNSSPKEFNGKTILEWLEQDIYHSILVPDCHDDVLGDYKRESNIKPPVWAIIDAIKNSDGFCSLEEYNTRRAEVRRKMNISYIPYKIVIDIPDKWIKFIPRVHSKRRKRQRIVINGKKFYYNT